MKKTSVSCRLLAVLLALAMTLALSAATAFAVQDSAAAPAATFVNTSGDGGKDFISFTDERTFEATIPVDLNAWLAKAYVNAGSIEWTLTRDEPFLDEELYPNYYKGTDLASFPSFDGDPYFSDIVTAVEVKNGQTYLKVTFACSYFGDGPDIHQRGTATNPSNQQCMDYLGWYDLSAVYEGEVLGSVKVKTCIYDAFLTMPEIYDEIDAIAAYDTDLYVEKFSMGKSQAGYDMPYLIVAKDRAAVDNWIALAERAETDPSSVLAEIESGKLKDYQVPVLFSNIHSNETVGADSIITLAWMLLKNDKISMKTLEGFTEEGEAQLDEEFGPAGEKGSLAVPDLIKDSATYLGYIKAGNSVSGKVDLEKYYEMGTETIKVKNLLKDVFFILVPEENVEGRTYMTRTSSGGFDLNRDNSFQTQAETTNMTRMIATFNPVSFTEIHGHVTTFQCEPCDPPHEPNFEYDLLAEHLMAGGEALGKAAVANNESYNSYVIPQRDYLEYTGEGDQTYWADPWDDMSTSYTPQYSMLHGCVAYTVEAPAYNDDMTQGLAFGQLAQAAYVAENKESYFADQLKIYERGVTNFNSNAFELVGQWFCDQYDVEGAEMEIFRPEYDSEGENGNFYPECYIIPLDGKNQGNLQAAYDMMEWLSRNDVKILVTEKSFTYEGVKYPAGTMIVSMYQAKRSVANGALYNGTVINNWTVLYSEGITAFNHTRGFDMITCAEPAAYEKIAAACGEFMDYEECLAYIADAESFFSGTKNAMVILSNASENSTAAVNALLKAGKKVSLITEGEHKGDFLCTYEGWKSVCEDYIITGTGVRTSKMPASAPIAKAPVVYISGVPADSASGCKHFTRYNGAYAYNYDRQCMDLLGFTVTDDASEADVVIGASALDSAALAAVRAGTPYVGYGASAIPSAAKLFEDGALVRNTASRRSMDALAYVTYPTENMTNASYIAEGDNILYGYGTGYFASIPEGAEVLVQLDGSKKLLEGFVCAAGENYEAFLNDSIQAISYEGADKDGNAIDVTLFANTLTNKTHQRDELAFISNTIFASVANVD